MIEGIITFRMPSKLATPANDGIRAAGSRPVDDLPGNIQRPDSPEKKLSLLRISDLITFRFSLHHSSGLFDLPAAALEFQNVDEEPVRRSSHGYLAANTSCRSRALTILRGRMWDVPIG